MNRGKKFFPSLREREGTLPSSVFFFKISNDNFLSRYREKLDARLDKDRTRIPFFNYLKLNVRYEFSSFGK